MRICLLTEGSYPYVVGGVSSWCQMLIQGLPEHEFFIYSIGAEAKNRGDFKYKLPANVVGVQEEFLTSMLGACMAKILLAYLDAKEMASQQEGIEEPEVDDELEFLADGLKESLADYVMYKMLRGTQLQMMNTGAVALKNANEHENTARRQASVWNTMVRRNLSFLDEARKRLSGYTISYVEDMVTTVNALNL